MSFDAGSIAGGMSWDISGYTRSMLQAESIASLFPHVVTSFLANPLLALIDIAKEAGHAISEAFTATMERAHEMGEAAERTGLSLQFLGTVGASAKMAGIGIDELSHSMLFFERSMQNASEGDETASKAFRDLGISVVDATGKMRPVQDVFYQAVDAFKAIEDPGKRVDLAMTLMSRAGMQMIPVMLQGSAAMRAWKEQMAQFGAGITPEMAEQGGNWEKLTSAWDTMWKGFETSIAAPVMEYVSDHFEQLMSGMIEFSERVRPMLANLGETIVQMLPAAMAFGESLLTTVVPALQGLLTVITPVLQALAKMLELLSGVAPIVAGMAVGGILGGVPGAVIGAGIGAAGSAMSSSSSTHNYNAEIHVHGDVGRKTDLDDLAHKINADWARQNAAKVADGL